VERGGGPPHDRHLVLLGEVVEHDLEHEAVELRLGERIGPLELDRVLGGEHEEGRLKIICSTLHRYAPLLHRLEQCRLGLGGRAVDLVREQHVREHRPRHERETPLSGGRIVLDDVGAGDVARHEIRRELDALELEVERPRERRDEEGLREPGHADEQAVAPGEQGDERLFDDVVVADDHLAQLGGDARAGLLEAVGELGVVETVERGKFGGTGQAESSSQRVSAWIR
jgi:hypothetical protein